MIIVKNGKLEWIKFQPVEALLRLKLQALKNEYNAPEDVPQGIYEIIGESQENGSTIYEVKRGMSCFKVVVEKSNTLHMDDLPKRPNAENLFLLYQYGYKQEEKKGHKARKKVTQRKIPPSSRPRVSETHTSRGNQIMYIHSKDVFIGELKDKIAA